MSEKIALITYLLNNFAEKGSWSGWLRIAESPLIGFFLHHTLPKRTQTRQCVRGINIWLVYKTLHRDKFCAYLVYTPIPMPKWDAPFLNLSLTKLGCTRFQ
jgi:hypothetical protein